MGKPKKPKVPERPGKGAILVSLAARARACSAREAMRFALTDPYFDGKRLIATDGRTLVVFPIQKVGKGAQPGRLDKYEESKQRDLSKKSRDGAFEIKPVPLPEGQKFPNVDEVIPVLPTSDPMVTRVSMNPRLLGNIVKALGCRSSVMLTFRRRSNGDSSEGPMLVKTDSDACFEGAIGVLMPLDGGDDRSARPDPLATLAADLAALPDVVTDPAGTLASLRERAKRALPEPTKRPVDGPGEEPAAGSPQKPAGGPETAGDGSPVPAAAGAAAGSG